jgi:alcohol dehydrogenase class IV
MPHIVVPTTYAGSEATPILGETEDNRKVTKSDSRILPNTIIYDVDLTLSLPVHLSVTSGMNAVAHAVEALYAREANPVISTMAEQGMASILRGLPRLVERPDDRQARSDCLYGAWLCGVCLGSVGMALHHKLCHTLGGLYGLPHASMHTALLPHALAYNAPAVPAAIARMQQALGSDDIPRFLYDIAQSLGAEMSLEKIGMPKDFRNAIDEIFLKPYWNPRPLERVPLEALFQSALEGRAPSGA